MQPLLEAAHQLGLTLKIATNGSRFQQERIDMLFDTELDEVVVSLNTPEKHLYEEQRGTDVSFEKYMEGIRSFIAEVVKRGAPPITTINILFDGSRIREPDELERVERITNEWIALQVKSALNGVPAEKLRRCIIAYEPIWAIGTGKVPTLDEIAAASRATFAVVESLRTGRVADAGT